MASFPVAYDPTRRIINVHWSGKRYGWAFEYVIAVWSASLINSGNTLSAGPSLLVALEVAFLTTTTSTPSPPTVPPPPPLSSFSGTGNFTISGKPADQSTGRPLGQSASITSASGGEYFQNTHVVFSGGGSNDISMDFSGIFATNVDAPGITWTNTFLVQAPTFVTGIGVIAGKSMMSPSAPFGPT